MPYHGIATRTPDNPFFKIIVTVSAKTTSFLVYSTLISLLMFFAYVLALIHT
jgi:hypothetical protein